MARSVWAKVGPLRLGKNSVQALNMWSAVLPSVKGLGSLQRRAFLKTGPSVPATTESKNALSIRNSPDCLERRYKTVFFVGCNPMDSLVTKGVPSEP